MTKDSGTPPLPALPAPSAYGGGERRERLLRRRLGRWNLHSSGLVGEEEHRWPAGGRRGGVGPARWRRLLDIGGEHGEEAA